ncbi:MAG: RHS repeat-associated core domain-containing protein, partial [Pseudomonadota bacterium]|nr:RHS repeat-associated core domain-containing protein [Pseudomonadota bacterium]
TDEQAQVVQRFAYGPYGELLSGDATLTPFLFNGMFGVMSEGNGLFFMRARFYSAQVKRFVNQDVLVGNVVRGQSLNRFAFVAGRPVSFVDPFGLAQEEVDRAADIVKTFLPHLYNEAAMPKMGDIPHTWFTRLLQLFGIESRSSGKTDIFGFITINNYFYSGSLFPLLSRQHSKRRRLDIEQKIEGILRTVIHEYMHSYDYNNYYTSYLLKTDPFLDSGLYGFISLFGPHQYIYERSNLLAKFLNQYMLLTDKEWKNFKTDKEKVKQVQWNIMPLLSWGLIPLCF